MINFTPFLFREIIFSSFQSYYKMYFVGFFRSHLFPLIRNVTIYITDNSVFLRTSSKRVYYPSFSSYNVPSELHIVSCHPLHLHPSWRAHTVVNGGDIKFQDPFSPFQPVSQRISTFLKFSYTFNFYMHIRLHLVHIDFESISISEVLFSHPNSTPPLPSLFRSDLNF